MDHLITIIAFYKFATITDPTVIQQDLQNHSNNLNIKGTILLSHEGINGSIAGTRSELQQIMDLLDHYPELKNLEYKYSNYDRSPFKRLKIKVKPEIITFGINNLNPAQHTGQYVEPKEWNNLISDPNTITIDPRNNIEIAIGKFKNAIDPNINCFKEFPKYFENNFIEVDRNQSIAMYCTGGIRCEKSTAYLLNLGFKHVYQLKGGIINYLEQIPPANSLWQGKCFIFDQRNYI